MSAIPGADIRYTTDGSTPTASSILYSGPITVASALTIKAVAFSSGWLPSGVASSSFSIDSTAPTITTTYVPAKNSAGWSATAVVAQFVCSDSGSGVADCPADVHFSAEGENQSVTVTATDNAGNTVSQIVAANIDLTPPNVVITTPSSGMTTAGTSVSLMAAANDGLSGIASAMCNGISATFTSGTVTCGVALATGDNTIVVTVTDKAGNSASSQVQVTAVDRPAIQSLTPQSAAIGAEVSVRGIRFGASQGSSQVTLGGQVLQPVYWSDTQVKFVVPSGARSAPVVVTVGAQSSNAIELHVAIGMRTTPQTSYVSPDEMTLAIGESSELTLVDPDGHLVTGVTWTIDDSTVAIVSVENDLSDGGDAPHLVGVASGQATVTATSALGTATGSVTVHAVIPAGTRLWSVYPDSADDFIAQMIVGQPKAPSDPAVFAVESLAAGGVSIRGITETGKQLWRTFVGRGDYDVSADSYVNTSVGTSDGGIVVDTGAALVKLSGAGTIAWTHAGTSDESVNAIGFDGSIYGRLAGDLAVWDGDTGALRYTVPLTMPNGKLVVHGNTSSSNPYWDAANCAPFDSSQPPAPLPIASTGTKGQFIAGDGHYYYAYQVDDVTFTSDTVCSIPNQYSIPLVGRYEVDTKVFLVELRPTGPGAKTEIAHDTAALGHNTDRNGPHQGSEVGDAVNCDMLASGTGCLPRAWSTSKTIPKTEMNDVIPDGAGGVMITRTITDENRLPNFRLSRIVGGAVQYEIPAPNGVTHTNVTITDDGTSVFSGGSQFTAIDPVSGAIVTAGANPFNYFQVLSTTDDGGFVMETPQYSYDGFTTTLSQIDATGTMTGTVALRLRLHRRPIKHRFPEPHTNALLRRQRQIRRPHLDEEVGVAETGDRRRRANAVAPHAP
jgi:hypothetical protein